MLKLRAMSSSNLQRQLVMALDFMPLHRTQSRRRDTLSLDALLDEAREQERNDWSPGLLDYILMAYRYTHVFRRELDRFSRQKLKPETLGDLLQISFAAVLTRDKVPPSALVSESVEVAKKRFGPYTASFTNAFLRQCLRNKDALMAELKARPEILLGPDLERRWRSLGAALRPLGEGLMERPEAGIWAFDDKAKLERFSRDEFFGRNQGKIQAMDPGSWALLDWIQKSVITSLEARTTAAPRAFTVLDACAAPGGKIIGLQALLQNSKLRPRYYATDAKFPRLTRLRENLTRWELSEKIPTALWAWGENPSSSENAFADGPEKFSLILADLPCSGSGTLASRPDLLTENIDERVASLKTLQQSILRDLKERLVPDGQLVVSLCSIDPPEIAQVAESLDGQAPDFYSLQSLAGQKCEGLTAWHYKK